MGDEVKKDVKRRTNITVSKVLIYPFEQDSTRETDSQLLAFADVTFNDQLTLKGFKVIRTRSGGLFVSYPSQKGSSGKYFDIAIPLTKELKSHIRDQVVTAFKNFTV